MVIKNRGLHHSEVAPPRVISSAPLMDADLLSDGRCISTSPSPRPRDGRMLGIPWTLETLEWATVGGVWSCWTGSYCLGGVKEKLGRDS